jgi:hypothetical protein
MFLISSHGNDIGGWWGRMLVRSLTAMQPFGQRNRFCRRLVGYNSGLLTSCYAPVRSAEPIFLSAGWWGSMLLARSPPATRPVRSAEPIPVGGWWGRMSMQLNNLLLCHRFGQRNRFFCRRGWWGSMLVAHSTSATPPVRSAEPIVSAGWWGGMSLAR